MAGIVLRSITPKKPILDLREFEKKSVDLLNRVADGIEKDFVSTYPKPTYNKTRATKALKMRSAVDSKDEILNYNVLGTRPHMIVPRRARVLRFQSGYTRKVRPRTIGRSGGGGPFGPVVYAHAVRHPGYEGSHVDETIAEKWQPKLEEGVRAVIKESTN